MRLRVHSVTGANFRRNGTLFRPQPIIVDTDELGWSREQIDALRATPALYVEPIEEPAPAPAPAPTRATKARE